jgi:hypothetical protein
MKRFMAGGGSPDRLFHVSQSMRRKEADMTRFEELALIGLAICGFYAWVKTILSAF